MVKKVPIFTKRVLPRSNTFVAAQGNNLPNFQPLFIGLRNDRSGIDLIDGNFTCLQQDHEQFALILKLMLDGACHLSTGWKQALRSLSGNLVHAHFGQ